MSSDIDQLNASLRCISNSISDFATKTEAKFAQVRQAAQDTATCMDGELDQIRIVVRGEVDELCKEIAQVQEEVGNTIQPKMTQLRNEVDLLRADVSQLSNSWRPTHSLPNPPRLVDPNRVIIWMQQMTAKLRIDGAAIGSEEAQFFYVFSNLGPQAQDQVFFVVATAELDQNWDLKRMYAALLEFYHISDDAGQAYAWTMMQRLQNE
ncbi:hypothetical protein F4781DRAFT_110704 [Annulohypoxylon bovei var. microspora]|nr:hypothetical protein F4781DRAFT_110704 [Annulohypoxylon bovei var. microspora]